MNAVSECGVTDGVARFSPDVVVFDPRWAPECIVELKHHSANQGKVDPVVFGLLADLARHKDGPQGRLPLIQIGLYTEISTTFDRKHGPLPFGLYRFLSTYVNGVPRQRLEDQMIPASLGGRMVRPGKTEFLFGGSSIVGRVGWILHVEDHPCSPRVEKLRTQL